MSWTDKLKQYAPDLVAAVLSGGATLPALALKAVADATGSPMQNVTQLGEYVAGATPEQLLEIKQANASFKVRMRELDVELQQSEIADVQDARKNHKHSPVPAILVYLLTAMVTVGLCMLFTREIPEANQEITHFAIGQLFTAWLGALAYWFGTTRSSANKSASLTKQKGR